MSENNNIEDGFSDIDEKDDLKILEKSVSDYIDIIEKSDLSHDYLYITIINKKKFPENIDSKDDKYFSKWIHCGFNEKTQIFIKFINESNNVVASTNIKLIKSKDCHKKVFEYHIVNLKKIFNGDGIEITKHSSRWLTRPPSSFLLFTIDARRKFESL